MCLSVAIRNTNSHPHCILKIDDLPGNELNVCFSLSLPLVSSSSRRSGYPGKIRFGVTCFYSVLLLKVNAECHNASPRQWVPYCYNSLTKVTFIVLVFFIVGDSSHKTNLSFFLNHGNTQNLRHQQLRVRERGRVTVFQLEAQRYNFRGIYWTVRRDL